MPGQTRYTQVPDYRELRSFRQNIGDKMCWFTYATPNQAIAIGGAPAEPVLTIDASSDFLALEILGFSDQDAGGVNFYTVEFNGASSGRNWQSAPVHSTMATGTAQRPHYLAVPTLLEAGSATSIRIVALNAAVAYNIRVALGGVKLFRR